MKFLSNIVNSGSTSYPSIGNSTYNEESLLVLNPTTNVAVKERKPFVEGTTEKSVAQTYTKGIGTITVTNGSAVATGSGSNNWTSSDPIRGMSFWLNAIFKDSNNVWYRAANMTVNSNTQFTSTAWYSNAMLINGAGTASSTYTGATGTYEYYIVRNYADSYSVALGTNSIATNFSMAFGSGSAASGSGSFALGSNNATKGTNGLSVGQNNFSYTGIGAMALGRRSRAAGNGSFASGHGTVIAGTTADSTGAATDKRVYALGQAAFNHSENTAAQTGGHGALAANSVILGGLNHNIPSNSNRSVILGGNTIKALSADTDTVYMPKVRIGQGTGGALTSGSTSVDLLVRSTGGIIQTRKVSTILTGATVTGQSTQIAIVNTTNNNLKFSSKFSFDPVTNNFIAAGNGSTIAGSNNINFGSNSSLNGGWNFNQAEETTWSSNAGNSVAFGWRHLLVQGSSGFIAGTDHIVSGATVSEGGFVAGKGGRLLTNVSTERTGFVYAFNTDSVDGLKPSNVPYLTAAQGGFNVSRNTSSQVDGHGVYGVDSGALMGINHNIPSSTLRSVIIGGDGIKAPTGITNTVFMPKVRIGLGNSASLVTNNSNSNILVRNSTNGEIEIRDVSTIISSGATVTANNGLTKIGNNIRLGGTLTGNTTISMDQYNFYFEPSSNYQLLGLGTDSNPLSNLEVRVGGSGSQAHIRALDGGSIFLRNFDFSGNSVSEISMDVLGTNGIAINSYDGYATYIRTINTGFTFNHELKFHNTGVTFSDFRTGSTAVGIEYAADYSANFTDRSLVDKGWVLANSGSPTISMISVTASTTLANTVDIALVSSSGGSVTVTLPATPNPNKKITIKDRTGNALTNNITIDGNGKNIDGSSTALLNTNRAAIELAYSSQFDEYYIVSFVN